MSLIDTINDNSKSFHFKTKTTGPLSLENYKNIKLESNKKKDRDFVNYFINWIRINNIYIYRVIEINKFYLVDESTIISDNYLICINRMPNNVKKRKNLKNFGATNDDFGYTTSRSHSRVFIVPPDIDEREYSKKMNKIYDEYDKRIKYISLEKFNEELTKENKIDTNTKSDYSKLSKITDNIENKNINSKFKIFKPNIAALNMLDRINKRNNKMQASKGSYVPPGARNKSTGCCTIVIKNIPAETDLSVKEINNSLRNIFEKYGMIDRVKTLTAKENNQIVIKGIAFIDFYDSKSVDKVLSDSTARHKIGYSILHVEKKNN